MNNASDGDNYRFETVQLARPRQHKASAKLSAARETFTELLSTRPTSNCYSAIAISAANYNRIRCRR